MVSTWNCGLRRSQQDDVEYVTSPHDAYRSPSVQRDGETCLCLVPCCAPLRLGSLVPLIGVEGARVVIQAFQREWYVVVAWGIGRYDALSTLES